MINYIFIALVVTGAVTTLTIALIGLYLFAVGAYVDGFLFNLKDRVYKRFGKLVGC
ncbi:hypothetical protein KAR91_24230 [Candidatus Pacearchaeota archaeon]|nr:hypothetical protein [Candidatus Pacearchaeota archaeon]